MNAVCALLAGLFAYLVLTAGATTVNYPREPSGSLLTQRLVTAGGQKIFLISHNKRSPPPHNTWVGTPRHPQARKQP